jgi:transposase InsO family protein
MSCNVFLVLEHERRRIVHFGARLTQRRNGRRSNFGRHFYGTERRGICCGTRDRIFGSESTKQLRELGVREVLGAPRVPKRRVHIERVIGTIRRECLDHLIVLTEPSLHRHLKLLLEYYNKSRTHLSLEKDAPASWSVQQRRAA